MSAPEPLAAGTPGQLRVGVQGEAGSFSHAALTGMMAGDAHPCWYDSFDAALDALERGDVDKLLLPVHNTLAGVVSPSLAAIAAREVRVDGEHEMAIRLVLAALPGTRVADLTVIRSHPIALEQCSRFLKHHPHLKAQAEFDTAGAARLLAERHLETEGVVVSREAAELYELTLLSEDIQDRRDNITRFWLLSRRRLGSGTASERFDRHTHLHLERPDTIRAVRGATTIDSDSADAVAEATRELLDALLAANGLETADVVSAIFTVTPDIRSAFPALAARDAGWTRVPLLCASEMDVEGGLGRAIRVLLHARPRRDWTPVPVYLRNAAGLRPDLSHEES